MNKRNHILQSLRYKSAKIITILLLILTIVCLTWERVYIDLAVFSGVLFLFGACFISIPIIGIWIYSFIKSIFRHTETDKVLLYVHILDLLLLGVFIYISDQVLLDCNPDIMAKQYTEYETQMWNTVNNTRELLPDSSRLVIEFEDQDYLSKTDLLNEKQVNDLHKSLANIGCIGIEVDNIDSTGNLAYSKLRFRRVGMGMYSFRLYLNHLTPEERENLNKDYNLIVFNDSTVFEYGSGVFGPQYFDSDIKQEFLEKLKSPQD